MYRYSSRTQSSRAGSADERNPLALAQIRSHYRISLLYSLMLQRNVVDRWLRPYLSILLRSFVCDGNVRAELGVISTLSCSCTTSRFSVPSRVSIIWITRYREGALAPSLHPSQLLVYKFRDYDVKIGQVSKIWKIYEMK